MSIKKAIIAVAVFLTILLGAISVTNRTKDAQAASDAGISTKLDQVLQGIAEIKEELRIIKIRITR